MRPLYEIRKDIEAFFDTCIDPETGEITDEARLHALQMERDEKVSCLACYLKNLEAENNGIRPEIDALTKRYRVNANKIAGLKGVIARELDGKKYHDARCSISFRKTERLEVADGAAVPDEYLKTTTTVDKAGLKKALKSGAAFPGVALVEGQSVIVK